MSGNRDSATTGAVLAVATYLIWGGIPAYFKAVEHVPPLEVLSHRVVWSVLYLAVLIALLRRGANLLAVLADRRLVGTMVVSSLLVSGNWLIFIWAVVNERVLETSLGYFINPLVSVVLGVAFLGERLRFLQWVAVGLAVAAVANLVVTYGELPWVALSLAFLFGFYGLVRKMAPVDAFTGLFVETLLICPVALAFLVYLAATGAGAFGAIDRGTDGLLLAAGIVTVVPLVSFVGAAKRLRLSTIGFFQYIAPTGQFLLAVFAWNEPFTLAYGVTFSLIWLALAIYSLDTAFSHRRSAMD